MILAGKYIAAQSSRLYFYLANSFQYVRCFHFLIFPCTLILKNVIKTRSVRSLTAHRKAGYNDTLGKLGEIGRQIGRNRFSNSPVLQNKLGEIVFPRAKK